MSNLNEIVKINSSETGSFSAQKNRISFIIPESDDVVDLSKSYINVNMSLNGDGTNVSASNVSFTDNGAVTHSVHTSMLVKNVAVDCAKKGLLESIRRADIYSSTKKQYEEDDEDKIDNNHLGLNAPRTKSKFALTPFRELNTDQASRELDHDVRIPLKDILGLGAVPQYDLSKFGRTKIACEMNFDKIASDFSLGAGDGAWTVDTNELGAMAPTSARSSGGDIDETVLKTTKTYEMEEWKDHSPFWVGQQLAVTRTDKVGAATVTVRLTAIAFDSASKQLQLTTTPSYGKSGDNAAISSISVVGVNPATNTLVINSAELVIEYNADKDAPSQVSIMTATTEEDNGANRTTLNKQYAIEPEAMGLIVALPQANSIFSNKTFLSYRVSVDNEPLTNRDVDRASPLDYDRKARYMQNKGKSLECLREKQLNKTHAPRTNQANTVRYDSLNNAILETLPITPGMKNLGLEINSQGGHEINDIVIFKEMIKSL